MGLPADKLTVEQFTKNRLQFGYLEYYRDFEGEIYKTYYYI